MPSTDPPKKLKPEKLNDLTVKIGSKKGKKTNIEIPIEKPVTAKRGRGRPPKNGDYSDDQKFRIYKTQVEPKLLDAMRLEEPDQLVESIKKAFKEINADNMKNVIKEAKTDTLPLKEMVLPSDTTKQSSQIPDASQSIEARNYILDRNDFFGNSQKQSMTHPELKEHIDSINKHYYDTGHIPNDAGSFLTDRMRARIEADKIRNKITNPMSNPINNEEMQRINRKLEKDIYAPVTFRDLNKLEAIEKGEATDKLRNIMESRKEQTKHRQNIENATKIQRAFKTYKKNQSQAVKDTLDSIISKVENRFNTPTKQSPAVTQILNKDLQNTASSIIGRSIKQYKARKELTNKKAQTFTEVNKPRTEMQAQTDITLRPRVGRPRKVKLESQ